MHLIEYVYIQFTVRAKQRATDFIEKCVKSKKNNHTNFKASRLN